eukprot:5146655-Prymnesium_polylepis.1
MVGSSRASFSTSCRPRSLSCCGICTSKCTNWWPAGRPCDSCTPRPCITRRSPLRVPGGTLSVAAPSRVGITTLEPRMASAS